MDFDFNHPQQLSAVGKNNHFFQWGEVPQQQNTTPCIPHIPISFLVLGGGGAVVHQTKQKNEPEIPPPPLPPLPPPAAPNPGVPGQGAAGSAAQLVRGVEALLATRRGRRGDKAKRASEGEEGGAFFPPARGFGGGPFLAGRLFPFLILLRKVRRTFGSSGGWAGRFQTASPAKSLPVTFGGLVEPPLHSQVAAFFSHCCWYLGQSSWKKQKHNWRSRQPLQGSLHEKHLNIATCKWWFPTQFV